MALQGLDAVQQVDLQLVVGGLEQFLALGVAGDVADALALGGAQLLAQLLKRLLDVLRFGLPAVQLGALQAQVGVEAIQHGGGVVAHAADVG